MTMRTWTNMVIAAALMLGWAAGAAAELQNVQVGGELRIRGYWWRASFNDSPAIPATVMPQVRWPAWCLRGRPIGDSVGGQNVISYWDWNDRGSDYKMVEQRTVAYVRAGFTDNVTGYIALDSCDIWGEDFRSNYVTGVDSRAASTDDVEVYEAYIEAADIAGYPIRLRLGRQELVLGDGWLVGNNTRRPEFSGLSFDGIRATYATDVVSVDAFWAKLNERMAVEEDGDVDLYGLYASYTGIENVSLDAYWLWLRDARALKDTNFGWFGEGIEDLLSVDDYDVTNLHTIGLRAAGTWNALDFNADLAYQFGNASQVGFLFKPRFYGDDDASYDSWAGALEVGYTLDTAWHPRFYLGGAYFEGEDNRDISFWEWLNPFNRSEASVSFNRLFSDVSYSVFIDEMGEMSNFWTVRGGVSVKPTDRIEAGVHAAYLASVESFDLPLHSRIGRLRLIWLQNLSFWTQPNEDTLGVEAGLWARYRYSNDLTFEAGWTHLFVGSGLAEGNYNDYNGLLNNGGTDDDDADYFYLETELRF